MNLTATRTNFRNPLASISKTRVRPTAVYSVIIVLAMIAFEAFNYSTTSYALRDLLGNMRFIGIQWATLMAIAFCFLDFAGIARLITQRGHQDDQKESWYLFSAWLLAATFNAGLTWWGVSIALSSHTSRSASVTNVQNLTTVIPVLVAIMVWVIRVLIIGMLSSALERSNATKYPTNNRPSTSTSTGFAVNSQSAARYANQHTTVQPSRSINVKSNSTTSQHRPGQTNEFMAAERRSQRL